MVSHSLQPVFLPAWVTKEAGIFAQHGLDVDLQVIASTAGMAALVANQTQVAHVGGGEALAAAAGGADLVDVAGLAPVYPQAFVTIPKVPDAQTLKGGKVGVTNYGSSSDVATRVSLKKLGLDPDKDVTIVEVGNGSVIAAALDSGAIQAGVVQMADKIGLENRGFHTLVDLAGLRLPAVTVQMIVSRSYANSHKDVIQRYVDSLVEGIVREKKDKAFTIGVLKKYLKTDDDAAMALNYDYFAQNDVTPAYPFPKAADFADTKDVLAKRNPKVADYDVAKMVDTSYVQSAQDRHVGQ